MDFNKTLDKLKKLNENAATEAISDYKNWCENHQPKLFVDQRKAFKAWLKAKGEDSFPMQVIKMIRSTIHFRE